MLGDSPAGSRRFKADEKKSVPTGGGIDPAESRQPYGERAKQTLSDLAFGQPARVVQDTDGVSIGVPRRSSCISGTHNGSRPRWTYPVKVATWVTYDHVHLLITQQVGKAVVWLKPTWGVGSQLCPVASRADDDEGPSYGVGVFPPPQELAKEPSGGRVHGWLAWAAVGIGLSIVQSQLRSLKDSATAGVMP